MWLPEDEEQQGWDLGNWCLCCAVPLLGDAALDIWGEISFIGKNLFCILWFSWGMSRPAIFPCQIGRMFVARANAASGRLCLSVTVQIWLVCLSLAKPRAAEVLVGR